MNTTTHSRLGFRRQGFTVIEMMVALAVLGGLMAAVTTIMVRMRDLVSTSQAISRANTRIKAISHVMHNDFRRLTRGGVLAITSSGTGPALVLVTGEPTSSIKTTAQGRGSVVVYAMRGNQGRAGGQVLWRPECIFPIDPMSSGPDVQSSYSLEMIQAFTEPNADTFATGMAGGAASGTIYVPPANLDQMDTLWQVLTEGVSDLEFEWTDGVEENGKLQWHSGPANSIQPLWYGGNTADWPKAIKIRFTLTLTDPQLPEAMRVQDIEVICDVLQ